MNGYTIRVAEAIRGADSSLEGVQLGLECLKRDIPVADVADALGVTRQTVYGWFYGATKPHPHHLDALRAWLAALQNPPAS